MITAAVVPVAGLGTRLLPASRSAPKEMLPVVDKPVVQYVVEELRAAGIRRLLFITGRRKRAIEDHFDHDPQLDAGPAAAPGSGLEILYTRQPRPAGLGDALRHATGFAASGPVVVALGDAILQSPAEGPGIVSRLIEAYEASGAAAAVAVTRVADVQRYGVVLVRGESVPLEVVDLVEKPRPEAAPSNLAIAARYVLGSEVFAALADTEPDEAGEIQLTTALRHVIAAGGRVVAVPLSASERRHDIGTVEGYCTTFLEHALTHPRWGEQLRARAQALLDESG